MASFYSWKPLSIRELHKVLNHKDPSSLRVWWIECVPRSFHATFSVQSRRYVYLFPLESNPSEPFPNDAFPSLDVERVHDLLQTVLGKRLDFYAFARDTPANKNCHCTIFEARAFRTSIPSSTTTFQDPFELKCMCVEVSFRC